jgi:hypothetical protein
MKMSLSTFLLRLFLGAFFVIIGLYGVLPNVDESIFSVYDVTSIEIIFGLIQLGCGMFLLASCFMRLSERVTRSASLIVLIFWLIQTFLNQFVFGIDYSNGLRFDPNFSAWLLYLSVHLLIGAAIYKVNSSVRD